MSIFIVFRNAHVLLSNKNYNATHTLNEIIANALYYYSEYAHLTKIIAPQNFTLSENDLLFFNSLPERLKEQLSVVSHHSRLIENYI